jgi:hypothetical protein
MIWFDGAWPHSAATWKGAELVAMIRDLQPHILINNRVHITGLPAAAPTPLFPVIRLECDGPPTACSWAKDRLWGGDPRRMRAWAAARGESVFVPPPDAEAGYFQYPARWRCAPSVLRTHLFSKPVPIYAVECDTKG